MTDLAALADELRERLNAIAYAKAIHGQDPTDTTWARYETAKCEAADWLYGKGDELQAALRASRPEPAADAVETAYREGYRTCWHFNVATDDPADEEIIGIEWRDSEAKKALSALPRPEADEGAVRKADEIFDDITRGGPTVDAVMREDWATVAEWMRQRAEDGLAVTRAALAALPRPADLEREERAHGVTIDQRDAAESALSEAYLVVTGQPPEWSNRFGYREALDDIRGALPRPSVVIVTDEMVDVAIDRWAGFREWRDTVCAGSRRLEMRAAIEAALTATCPVVPDCCPVCGGDCGSANPPVMDCPMRPERGGALPRPAVDEGAVERATLAAYDAFFEGQIGCCEPSWDELPDSHKDRMRRSIRAALAAAQEGQR